MLLTPVSLWRCVVLSRVRDMSTEDEPKGPPLGFSSTREDVSLSFVDLANSPELGRRSREHRLHTATPHTDVNWWGPYMNRHRIKCTCSGAKHVHQQLQPKRLKEFAWFFCLFFFSHPDFTSGKSPFLKILTDAEAAANAAAIQLVSFKDAMEGELSVCCNLLCGVHELRLLETTANYIHQTV